MARQLQLRKGTTAQHSTFTGALAEVTVDTTKKTVVVHDGVTVGGFPLVRSSELDSHTTNTSNPHNVTKTQVGLGNVDNTSDLNKPISTATQTALGNKVDKVAGKQLSTEDYTTAEKNKLAGLSNYTLPTASNTIKGGIIVGSNLSIDANGVLSASAGGSYSWDTISNKPTTIVGYGITDAYTKTQVNSLIPDISTKQDTLVSGTNIKTINGQSVLGSGDIVISGGEAADLSEYYKKTETYSKVEVDTIISNISETDLTNYYNKTEVDTITGDIALALDTINGEVV